MNLDLSLEELTELQLLRPVGNAEPAYRFKHALVQETVYSSLLLKDRKRLHELVGDTLEDAFGAELDEVAPELAEHFAQAGAAERAVPYFIRAGERAMQISAYPEAIQAYERALTLLPLENKSERARILVRLGEIHDRRSERNTAIEKFQAGLALAEEEQQSETAVAALCGLASLASRAGDLEQAKEYAQAGIAQARQAADPLARAQALRQLGIIYNLQGDNDRAGRDLEAALALYRQLQDEEGIARCLNSLGVVAINRREWSNASDYFHEALELSRRLGDRYGVGVRLLNLSVLAEEQGDLEGAQRYLAEALGIAQEIGDREGIVHIDLNLGSLRGTQGDISGAMRYFREALTEARALDLDPLALYIVAAVAGAHVRAGRYRQGAQLLGFALQHPAASADIETDFDSVLVTLRENLPPAELAAALAPDGSLTLETVTRAILVESITATTESAV